LLVAGVTHSALAVREVEPRNDLLGTYIQSAWEILQATPIEKRKGHPPAHLRWVQSVLDREGRCISGKAPNVTETIERIADEATQQYGVEITPRQVRGWLAKYRKLCQWQ
jgi:uncharacterized protein YciI